MFLLSNMAELLAQALNSPNLSQNGLVVVLLVLLGTLVYVIRDNAVQQRATLQECNLDRKAETAAKVQLAESLITHSKTIEMLGRIVERRTR